MSKKNRNNVATVSASTQAAADLRKEPTTVEQAIADRVDAGFGHSESAMKSAALPMPTDAQLNAAIDVQGDGADVQGDGADVQGDGAAERNPKDSSSFRLADDVAKKGPYKTEAEARLPENVYRNKGPQWDVLEIDLPTAEQYEQGLAGMGLTPGGKCYVYAVNNDLAISFMAKKVGWDCGKAGAKVTAPGVKARLEAAQVEVAKAQDAVAAERAKNAAILAKLKEMGIEL